MPRESSSSVRVFYPRYNAAELAGILTGRLKNLESKLPLTRAVLFGSYAKGDYTIASDVDLLLVYKGEPRDDSYALCKRTLGIEGLEPHIYTEDEYRAIKGTIERMVEGGIDLLP